ncbi:MAG: ATP-dependent helicase [Candidatus Thermoplasmatota archaeon]|nr:ATP-dependent helicase [Candidatus Thermoplasmatota archaeon]MBS3801913.1 ATP-dependent helicase [Candidatus Thermoplasmatota archaeon]
MNINQEKKEIINCSGNVLVTANPGTGKTLLLAYKYVNLIKKGVKPDQILCLTFTRKARKEMEDRITKILYDENIKVDISDLYIHTFHSFALDTIEEADLVSTNLLRYSIYRYLRDHNTLNYSDGYLLATIVPKMENLIRYLKSFGITTDMINVEHVKSYITDFKQYTKEELERFLEEFVQIFQYYEQVKGSMGLDYSDMLIDFLKQNNTPSFQYVLVDELQDVNKMEADIALNSAETFIAVGDQKQAIFGFQGGSILNFEKFKDSTSFVLSENFRSTNAILDYARDYFSSKTKEKHHIKELAHLRNKKAYFGTNPIIYDVPKEEIYPAVSRLAKAFSKKNKQVAIIARTNTQISNISKELELRNIDHSSTFFSASNEAQTSIISFLKGVLSNNIDYIKEAMFTPFFPISLEEAFRLSEKKYLSLSEIYTACQRFKTLKKRMGNLEDVNQLFRQKIIPISISYGEEYLLAALAIKDAFQEAMKVIDHKTIENLSAFLQSTDLLASESNIEKNIVLTTVHKSKGKQFDTVIYVPTKTQNRANFQDAVVKAILQSKKVNAEEELEEETLRVNFVAFTRAKKELYVITDQTKEYQTNSVTVKDLTGDEIESELESEQQKRAFTLFVNKDYDSAKKLLEQKHEWIKDFIKNHFEHLDSLSFSAITTDAYDYLKQRILRLGQSSEALTVGSDVHQIAEHMIEGEQYQVKEEYEPYETNIKRLIEEIHEEYPEDFLVEKNISVSLKELINHETPIKFSGKLDAVFKNNDQYLIVDWKTSKNPNYGSSHRRQLAAYKKAFSIKYNIPLENINVAIGYVGLKKIINDGTIGTMLDKKQPSTTAVNTFEKHVQTILTWKNNIDLFFKELEQTKQDDVLLRNILEQYQKEKN